MSLIIHFLVFTLNNLSFILLLIDFKETLRSYFQIVFPMHVFLLLVKSPKNRSSDCKLSFVISHFLLERAKMDVIEDTLTGQTHFDKSSVHPPAGGSS